MSQISKLPEFNHLQKKILYTLFFLALYRIGVNVPIPGVDTEALSEFFQGQGGNFFGIINMYTGQALERFSIFALGVTPYISASIIAQLLTVVVPSLEALSKEGEAGRRKINQYTRYGTIVLALIQGYVIASSLGFQEQGGRPIVVTPGIWWNLFATLSLTAGTAFVMWLGEQITDRGVGNGMSLIIFCGIVAGLPSIIANTYQQYNSAEMGLFPILLVSLLCVAICAGVIFVEQGARLVPVQYAKRQVGRRQFGGQSTSLPIRINSAGVIPPIFASALLQIPTTIMSFRSQLIQGTIFETLLDPSGWAYSLLYATMIIFFAFFWITVVFKPDDIAENLKKNGGFVPGIRPGARTAEYLNRVIMRLTVAGGMYLAAICVIPSVLMGRFGVQFYFGGTSLLIVVGVALETFRQIEAHRQSLRYDSFLKSGSIRPRGRRPA